MSSTPDNILSEIILAKYFELQGEELGSRIRGQSFVFVIELMCRESIRIIDTNFSENFAGSVDKESDVHVSYNME